MIDMNETATWGKTPNIKKDTLEELAKLLDVFYPNKWRYCVDVETGSILKTIDNEDDAQETIRRIKEKVKK